MKKKNYCKLLLIVLVSVVFLSSCRDIYLYRQDHPELNSMAVESIIGSTSSEMNRVVVLDRDSYGRTLFAFMGYSIYGFEFQNPHILAIVISQQSDDQYVFYYDSKNYIATTIDSNNYDILNGDLGIYFSDDAIDELKSRNSWNQPIKDSQLFRISVTRKKVCAVTRQEIRRYERLFDEGLNLNYIDCYSIDKNGLHIVSLVAFPDNDSSSDYIIYLVLLNEKHELISEQAILDITSGVDLNIIQQFKIDWGWSFTYK
jgi:hypothetical protein